MKDINPNDLNKQENYKLLTGSVVPRAIAWVSSQSADGVLNLAPFSFFTVVTANPPTILFCPGMRGTDKQYKDTYHNIHSTGEFVVNVVSEALAEAMVLTSAEVPAEVNEFERAGLTPLASSLIAVPRVAESLIQFECRLQQIVPVGDAHVIIGEVVYMHFADEVLSDKLYVNMEVLQPIGRLAGNMYTRVNDLFAIQRPPSEIQPTVTS